MLARRLRRRPSIDPTLVQCLVFAGMHDTAPIVARRRANIKVLWEDERTSQALI